MAYSNKNTNWRTTLAQDSDRRHDDPHLAVLNTILVQLGEMHSKLEELASLKPELQSHIVDEEKFQNELRVMVTEAFPNGDVALHRMEHEAARERAKLCKEFWQSLLAKLGEKSIFAILAVAWLIITYWWNGQMHLPTLK